jgi:hypothetical protein
VNAVEIADGGGGGHPGMGEVVETPENIHGFYLAVTGIRQLDTV